MKSFLLILLSFFTVSAFAQDFLIIKKSMNPKNILHYKAEVRNCKLSSTAPITPYWIMGEDDGHTEGLTSKEKGYFSPKVSYSNDSEADFSLGAMEKMSKKMPDSKIQVRLVDCKPKAFINYQGDELQIKEIFVQVSWTMSVSYMTLTGISHSGEKVTVKIDN